MIDINIDYASDDSCQIQLWAKGTHNRLEFGEACKNALFKYDEREINTQHLPIKYDYWRTVKAPVEISSYGVCDYIHIPSKKGKGAYAVTVLDIWLPLHKEN